MGCSPREGLAGTHLQLKGWRQGCVLADTEAGCSRFYSKQLPCRGCTLTRDCRLIFRGENRAAAGLLGAQSFGDPSQTPLRAFFPSQRSVEAGAWHFEAPHPGPGGAVGPWGPCCLLLLLLSIAGMRGSHPCCLKAGRIPNSPAALLLFCCFTLFPFPLPFGGILRQRCWQGPGSPKAQQLPGSQTPLL